MEVPTGLGGNLLVDVHLHQEGTRGYANSLACASSSPLRHEHEHGHGHVACASSSPLRHEHEHGHGHV